MTCWSLGDGQGAMGNGQESAGAMTIYDKEEGMGQQLRLGTAVGLVVSLMCWRGNQTPHLISTFPDLVTLIVLAVLLNAAVRFDLRWRSIQDRATSLRAGLTIGAAAGVVFGSTVAVLGLFRFSHPTMVLLAFGFLTAFASALACGAVAAMSRREFGTPGTIQNQARLL